MDSPKPSGLRAPSRIGRVVTPGIPPTSPLAQPTPKPFKIAPLSTPSPSAAANGARVDVEIEKLRRLSQEFVRKDSEHSLTNGNGTRSKSPSPQPQPAPPSYANFKQIYNNNNNNNINNNSYNTNNNKNGDSSNLSNGLSGSNSSIATTTSSTSSSFHHKRAKSPLRENGLSPSVIQKGLSEEPFLPFTFPDLPSYKMPSQRRFSEEVPSFRRPLATLHEDEVVARRRFSEDVRKKSLDASVVLTEDTDSFIIGDRVWVGGTKGGHISYIGETQFAPGEWAGVTLDEPIGKNDGSVAGVRYFQCESKKGVFSRLTRLSRAPLTDQDIEILTSRSSTIGSDSPKTNGTPTASVASGPTSAPTTPTSSTPDMKIGDRVVINSASGVKFGVLRFTGKTDFADGVWAGVELDEPTGKNDGSVAGKKYFECRNKYGLFAPIARVSKFTGGSSTPRRTSVSQTPRANLRRSNSRESIGGSSVASSTTSSMRGTRRPSTTRTSSTAVPSTKALQEALSEKTQHVDQLMRERDLERSEVARMAAQADEATRAARDMRGQLDQLQVESEERLHDLGERVRLLEKEREEVLTKLEDKQREVDDLSFRLEEESITKADLEKLEQLLSSQTTTDSEAIKVMKKELDEFKRRMTDRGTQDASKAFEMEELEINLRASVEELQARVMDLERDKEEQEKQLAAKVEQISSLETNNEALKNDISEREQRMKLLESRQEEDAARSSERTTEMDQKDELVRKLQQEVEGKSKEFDDMSQQAEEVLQDLIKEKKEKEALQKAIEDIKTQLKSGSSEAASLANELDKVKEELSVTSAQLEEAKAKNSSLEAEKAKANQELQQASSSASDTSDQQTEICTKLQNTEKELNIYKEKLENSETALKTEQESKLHQNETAEKQLFLLNEEHSMEIAKLQESMKNLGNTVKEKDAEIGECNRKITTATSHISSLEEQKQQLEAQVAASLTSSSDSSQQLTSLNEQLRDKEKQLEAIQGTLREKEAALSKEVEVRATESKAAKQEVEEVKQMHESQVQKLSQKLESLEKALSQKEDEATNAQKKHETLMEELTKQKDLEVYEAQEKLMLKDAEVASLTQAQKNLESQVKAMSSESASKEGNMEKALADMRAELEKLVKEKTELVSAKTSLEERIASMEKDNSKLHTEREETLLAVSERDQKVAALKAEVEMLMSSFNTHREDLQKQLTQAQADKEEMAKIQKDFEEERKRLDCLQGSLAEKEQQNQALQNEKEKLEKEVDNLKVVEGEKTNLVKEKDKLKEEMERLKALEAEKNSLLSDKDKLENELKQQIESLESGKDQLSKDKISLENSIEQLKRSDEERNRLASDVQKLQEEVSKIPNLQEENAKLSASLSKVDEENKTYAGTIKKMEEELKQKQQLVEDNTRISSTLKNVEEEKNKLLVEIKRLEADAASQVRNLEGDHSKLMETVHTLEGEKKQTAEALARLEEEVKKLRKLEEEKNSLESNNLALVKTMEELKMSTDGRIGELETEKFNLIEEVVGLQDQLATAKTEVEGKVKKLQEAEEEVSNIYNLRCKVNSLETEKRSLENKIVDLRVQVASKEISNNDSESFVKQLKDEKDQFEGQVTFLNSVIVDMQRKNDELKTRIEIFELGNIPDDTKANMNGVTPPGRHVVAPRLYCDICDCFDAHDTEDCPKQASSDSPPPLNSQHHGVRHSIRAYCDSCEVFGHETGECNGDETF